MADGLHPSELHALSSRLWHSRTVQIVSLTAAGCCLGLSLNTKQNPTLRFTFNSLGLVTSVVSMLARKTGDEAALALGDWHHASRWSRQERLLQEMSPATATTIDIAPNQTLEPFNWQELVANPDDYPMLAILGKPGGGKSTLAENMAALFGGYVIAVNPHSKPGDYKWANLQLCGGRNYGSGIDVEDDRIPQTHIPFEQIKSGEYQPNCCEFLLSLYWEMDRRYKLYEQGADVGEEILAIMDEFNAWVSLPSVSFLLEFFLREARKARIRFVVILHTKGVKSLKLEGKSELLEAITIIRTQALAVKHAKYLRNQCKQEQEKAYWNAVLEMLNQQKYPTMVDDEYAVRPAPGEWKKHVPPTPSPPALGEVQSPSPPTQPEPTNGNIRNQLELLLDKTPTGAIDVQSEGAQDSSVQPVGDGSSAWVQWLEALCIKVLTDSKLPDVQGAGLEYLREIAPDPRELTPPPVCTRLIKMLHEKEYGMWNTLLLIFGLRRNSGSKSQAAKAVYEAAIKGDFD